jgi:hypothetical protein
MNPPKIIPDFLVEELRQLDDPELLAVALHAESNGAPPDRVPEDVRMAFAMQDDETVTAVGQFARELANSKNRVEDERETESGTRSDENSEAAAEQADDDTARQNQGLFRDGW